MARRDHHGRPWARCGVKGDPSPPNDVRELADAVRRLVDAVTGEARPPVSVDDWMSTQELATRTGRHPETIRRWIADHGLPAKKTPSGWLVRYGDFLAWDSDGADDATAVIDAVLRRTG